MPVSDSFIPPQRWLRLLAAWCFALGLASSAVAQDLPAPAADALQQARAAMEEAIALNEDPFPDRPHWSEAIRHARRAVDEAPEHPRTLGLLAELYSRTSFHAPAWATWTRLLDAGHSLTSAQTPLFVRTGEEMAYAAYGRGERQAAAEIHMTVLDEVPFSRESRVWLGRIRMEQGRPADAIPYWRAVTEQDPDDRRAQYFLELATDQVRWGVDAVNRFREGVAHYEEGDLDASALAFERATDANPEYAEAWAWRGRVAFENEEWLVARSFYANALELDPENETYRYFRSEAERRADG